VSAKGRKRGQQPPPSDRDPWRLHEGEAATQRADPDESLNTGRIADPHPEHTPLYRWLSGLLIKIEAGLRARGGTGLRRAIAAGWAVVAMIGIVLLVGPVINTPLSFDDVIESADLEAVDWVMNDGVVRFDLDRDPDGAFVANISERFVAEMRGADESSIVRLLPTQYEGNDLELAGVTATIDGEPATVTRTPSLTYVEVMLGAASGEDLDGSHEVTLDYELRHLAVPEIDEVANTKVDLFSWNAYSVDLLQAARGITVEVTLPNALDEQLVRAPRGSVAWLLVSGSAWLEPDPELSTADRVGYSFTNDNSWPPHSVAMLTLVFEPGTFTMPPHTPLFWVQTFGPVVPLVLLAAMLLFALAARAVAWADAHGRPWILARHQPPDGISAPLAAQLLRKPAIKPLAAALDVRPRKKRTPAWVVQVARIAARAGRLGDLPRALRSYLASPDRRTLHEQGLRRTPVGYVRDAFIWAPIALTLVQWGLVRQLSHQTVLAVVWWPVAFVLLSTAISLIILWIALAADPLTHQGALLKQYLRGIEVYADRTQALQRGTLDDSLLPFVVLFGRARDAGKAVLELAQHESGDRDIARGWNRGGVIRPAAVAASIAAVALFAGVTVVAATQPYPYPYNYDTEVFDSDLPGTLWTSVQDFDAAAELHRSADGRAEVRVRERMTVEFEPSPQVPQFAREWPNLRHGQSLGVRVDEVRIDGEAVAYREVPRPRSLGMVTELADVLVGEHEVIVEYTLTSAAVATTHGGGVVEEVRWSALYHRWTNNLEWGGFDEFSAQIELRVAAELVDEIQASGWLTRDYDRPRAALEWGNGIIDWRAPQKLGGYDDPTTQLGTRMVLPDGTLVVTLTPERSQHDSWSDMFSFTDLGAQLEFADGTFVGPDLGEKRFADARYELPNVSVIVLTIALILASIWLIVAGRVRETMRPSPTLKTFSFFVLPVAGIAQFVLFFWATSDMPPGHERFPAMGWLTLISIVMGGIQLWSVLAKPVAPRT
jgi:hypothetical protein